MRWTAEKREGVNASRIGRKVVGEVSIRTSWKVRAEKGGGPAKQRERYALLIFS